MCAQGELARRERVRTVDLLIMNGCVHRWRRYDTDRVNRKKVTMNGSTGAGRLAIHEAMLHRLRLPSPTYSPVQFMCDYIYFQLATAINSSSSELGLVDVIVSCRDPME